MVHFLKIFKYASNAHIIVATPEFKKKDFAIPREKTDDSGALNPHPKLRDVGIRPKENNEILSQVPVRTDSKEEKPDYAAGEAFKGYADGLTDGMDSQMRRFAHFTVVTLSKVPEAALKLVKPKKEEV